MSSKIIVNKRKEAIERILYPDLPTEDNFQNNRLISKDEANKKLEKIMKKEGGRFTPFCVAIKQVLESKLEIGY